MLLPYILLFQESACQVDGTYKIPKEMAAFESVQYWKLQNRCNDLSRLNSILKAVWYIIITLRATTSSGLLSTHALNTWANPPWPAQPLIWYFSPPSGTTNQNQTEVNSGRNITTGMTEISALAATMHLISLNSKVA